MTMSQRIPELEATTETRESSETASEETFGSPSDEGYPMMKEVLRPPV